LDRSAGALIVEAVHRGMGIINAAVYGGGILASQGGGPTTYGYRPAPPEILEAIAAMRRACTEHGADLTTAALQFSLRDARLSSTVVGMSRPERVEDTVAAASRPVPEVLWGQIESLLPPERVWLDPPLKR
jgi:D-threo-aldose 1-dehydrogenase